MTWRFAAAKPMRGRLIGNIQADQSISFQAMQKKLADFVDIVRTDPAVEGVVAFTGGQQRNRGNMFVALKPLAERPKTKGMLFDRPETPSRSSPDCA